MFPHHGVNLTFRAFGNEDELDSGTNEASIQT